MSEFQPKVRPVSNYAIFVSAESGITDVESARTKDQIDAIAGVRSSTIRQETNPECLHCKKEYFLGETISCCGGAADDHERYLAEHPMPKIGNSKQITGDGR